MKLLKGFKRFTDGIVLAIFWLTISIEFTFIVMNPTDFFTDKASLILSIKATSLLFFGAMTGLILCYLNFRRSNLDKITPEVMGFFIATVSLLMVFCQNNLFR